MSSRTASIVVGVDGSDSSKAALRWAARQARATGAQVRAVHAWSIPNAYGYVPSVEDWEVQVKEELEETITGALSAPDAARVRPELVRGSATAVLEQAARDAHLLVVGSRGRGELTGMLLGSVSQFLVTHVEVPVVVVHADR